MMKFEDGCVRQGSGCWGARGLSASHLCPHVRPRKDVWTTEIESVLGAALTKLRSDRPLTQEDGATGTAFSNPKITAALQKNGEIRGVTCNITWTPAVRASADLASPSPARRELGASWARVRVSVRLACVTPGCVRGGAWETHAWGERFGWEQARVDFWGSLGGGGHQAPDETPGEEGGIWE